jgi:hypothetical protein
LANAAYTNMLTHTPTVTKVAAKVARSRARDRVAVLKRSPVRTEVAA